MVNIRYILQAIKQTKSYSHKPHLADLPHDRRTRDPEKLQERLDAIEDRIKENKKEINNARKELDDLTKEKEKLFKDQIESETGIADAEKEIKDKENEIESSSEEFEGKMGDATDSWGEFYESLGNGEQVPSNMEFGEDYYNEDEALYDELTGEIDDIDRRIGNISGGDARDFEPEDITELESINDDINNIMDNYYYGTDNTTLYTNLFDENINLLNTITEARNVINMDEEYIQKEQEQLQNNAKENKKIDQKINDVMDKLDKLENKEDDYIGEQEKTETLLKEVKGN